MRTTYSIFTLVVAAALVACGGGGGSSVPSSNLTNSVGIWSGRTSTTPPDFPLIVVRPSGETWLFNYDAFSIQGVGLLDLSESGNTSQSSAGTYFSDTDGVLQMELSGSALRGSSFGGTFRFPSLNASTNFSSTYENSSNLSLAGIARSWDVGNTFTMTIQTTGAFVAADNAGCEINGTIRPTNEGYSTGTVAANTTSACRIPNASLTGLIYSTGSSIWMALLTPAKDNRYLFYSRICSSGSTYSGVDFTWSCF